MLLTFFCLRCDVRQQISVQQILLLETELTVLQRHYALRLDGISQLHRDLILPFIVARLFGDEVQLQELILPNSVMVDVKIDRPGAIL